MKRTLFLAEIKLDLHDQYIREEAGADIWPRCKNTLRYHEWHTEAEVLQTEQINSSISNAKAKIVRLKPTAPAVIAPQRTTSPPVPVHEHFIQLPILDLLHFTGNLLHWQLFWYCFAAAIDNNPSLTRIQKLSYFYAQLDGHVVNGYQMTNDSYAK